MTDVDLVVDFLNTVDHDAHTDVLSDPDAWRRWLADRGLADSTAVRAVRSALRAAVGDPVGSPAGAAAAVTVELAADGVPRLVAADVVGAVLAAASRLAVLGQWARVKICPAGDCRWAFFDRSRNRSRTWCSMQVCGNREKARAWRSRGQVPR
ncbi:CGNR zinc finger domain-containing protein [Actinophytocola glycyrrhizae]|uniref:CGNR zinc finger domain-containing protein n=1 Tax=Actinophytocola glycyrrhizae TaxID=2044873 RepID=A0ABV9SEE0_9PSEU